MTSRSHDAARDVALLEWQLAMGVDEAIADAPQDRFRETAARMAAKTSHKDAPVRENRNTAAAPSPPFSGGTPHRASETRARPQQSAGSADMLDAQARMQDARGLAEACGTLDELKQAMVGFEGLALKKTATNLVFSDGNPQADLMMIGEAPGREEDLQGKPFVGRSGQLLDRMLKAIERGRDSVYITNVINWRPPGNRAPTPAETAICRPFIDRHIALVDPKIIVFLGGVAAKEMLGVTTGIMRLHGKWHDFQIEGGPVVRAMGTLHPAYLLRQPAHKRLAWRDFLELRRALEASIQTETD